MAQPADKIEGEILPEPELNPLLNPLLAAHMGRWAEVYFTSPPEKRAQAVSDLVRELRSGPPPQSSPVQPVVEQRPAPEPVREVKAFRVEPIPASPGVEQSLQTCGECSAENPAQQKFCGMCGATLQSSPTFPSNASASEITAIEETREEYLNETQSSMEREQATGDYAAQYAPDSSFSFGGYASRGSREQGRFVEDAYLPQFAVESPSVPYRYRLYIGIAVAVLLGGLLYMAWHRTPNSSGDTSESVPSRVMPSAPSRATPARPPEPAPQRAVVPTDKASDTAPARTAPPTAAPSSAPAGPASNNSSGRQSQASSGSDTAQAPKEKAPSPRIVSVAANSSAAVPGSTGAEELATAEKYLNGGYQGGVRDNREAAQWLWKAVGKGNLTATLVLSDLYLRGDGIPKSCDQARLLLNVAARKGKAAAGERLRNLQAFGCQ